VLVCKSFLTIAALSLSSFNFAFADAALQTNISLAPFTDELNHQSINSIHRDRAGFLWIATQLGLNRYDGSDILAFDSDKKSAHWIPDSDVSQIAEDLEGHIWITTGGGLAKYDAVNKTFFQPFRSNTLNSAYLKTLLISSTGKIWFGSRDSGVGMYDPSLQRFSVWPANESLRLNIGQTAELIEDRAGNIWAGGNNGLYLVDPLSQTIELFELPAQLRSASSFNSVTAMEPSTQDLIWIGTSKGDLLVFDTLTGKFDSGDNVWDLSGSWITDIEYFSQQVWVSTDSGIHLIDLSIGTFSKITQANSAISNNFVSSLFADEQAMWVGTALGLNTLSLSTFEKFQNENSSVYNDVMSFAEGVDDIIWIGTYDGVFSLSPNSRVHSPIEETYKNLVLRDRRVMVASTKGTELWLGFYNGGIQIVDQITGDSRVPALPTNSDLAVTDILHAKDGSTWIGTYNYGLFHLEKGSIESFYDKTKPDDGIFEPTITIVKETLNNSIIVVAESKMFRINKPDGAIESLELLFPDSLKSTVILSLTEDRHGNIWIGTKDKGLFIWHTGNDLLQNFDIETATGNNELPSSTIYAIEIDIEGATWVSTTNGISKLNSEGHFLANFKPKDGLQGNDFNFSASFTDSNGMIYFGGSNGYNRFNPNETKASTVEPRVVFTRIELADSLRNLPVPAHEVESIEVSHNDHSITFGFSVLDYIDPKNNQYRYKLKNFDLEWIENGTHNSAAYTNLPAGNYIFQVQGANSAGVWNRNGASIALTVHPAPWWSWQAYLAYLLLLSTIAVLAKGYYDGIILTDKALAMAQEMNAAADRASDDLQEQLDFQEDFLRTVYKHGSDTLGLIRDFLAGQVHLFADELLRDAILSNVYRVEALQQLEKSLLYHGDQLLVSPEALTNGIINSNLQQYPEMAPTVITINQMPPQLISAEYATPLCIILFELIRNCFEHAFEASSTANYIQIELKKVRDENNMGLINTIQISVTDSGVGIPDNILSGTVETSGLAIVSSIVEKLTGEIEASVNQGTRISITIPGNLGLV
jgi:ligand-binding sensor domain-containing protein/two-component sensor histidine kinase